MKCLKCNIDMQRGKLRCSDPNPELRVLWEGDEGIAEIAIDAIVHRCNNCGAIVLMS